MTKNEKITMLEKPSFAYYNGFGGIVFKEIEYGIEDYIIFLANAWYGGTYKDVHRVKIHYGENGDYIRFHGFRIPLNECVRM